MSSVNFRKVILNLVHVVKLLGGIGWHTKINSKISQGNRGYSLQSGVDGTNAAIEHSADGRRSKETQSRQRAGRHTLRRLGDLGSVSSVGNMKLVDGCGAECFRVAYANQLGPPNRTSSKPRHIGADVRRDGFVQRVVI